MALDIAGGLFQQSDVRETPTSDLTGQAVPVGAILPWAKSLGGVPALTSGFVECNGQTLSDGDSPLDGQVIPNLNGGNRFLRGNSASGATGGATSTTASMAIDHTYTGGNSSGTEIGYVPGNIISVRNPTGSQDFGRISGDTTSIATIPPYYNVVWIMRIK